MTNEELIKEIAKYMCNVCDFKCDSFQSGVFCAVALENAEAIYNVVYRKVEECKKIVDQLEAGNG